MYYVNHLGQPFVTPSVGIRLALLPLKLLSERWCVGITFIQSSVLCVCIHLLEWSSLEDACVSVYV